MAPRNGFLAPPQTARPRWKATKRSEMRLLLSRILGSLRSAGFTVEQQIDACINLGRTFGVDIPYLKHYLERNLGSEAASHPFFNRVWEPAYRVGEPVRAVTDEGPVAGVVEQVLDPSELGVAGTDRPYLYVIRQGEAEVQVWEYQIVNPPKR